MEQLNLVEVTGDADFTGIKPSLEDNDRDKQRQEEIRILKNGLFEYDEDDEDLLLRFFEKVENVDIEGRINSELYIRQEPFLCTDAAFEIIKKYTRGDPRFEVSKVDFTWEELFFWLTPMMFSAENGASKAKSRTKAIKTMKDLEIE